MASFPAPPLVQGSDEELLEQLGQVIFPGCIERATSGNGLRVRVKGDPRDPQAADLARARFQTVLGVLRAGHPKAGELAIERMPGLGAGSVQDENGNQYVMVGPVLVYVHFGDEVPTLAKRARTGIQGSRALRNALWLHGRPSRTAADYYMIYEYAKREFGGKNGIKQSLGIPKAAQKKFTQSANNLSPIEGGRHAERQAGGTVDVPLSLEEQRGFAGELVKVWIYSW